MLSFVRLLLTLFVLPILDREKSTGEWPDLGLMGSQMFKRIAGRWSRNQAARPCILLPECRSGTNVCTSALFANAQRCQGMANSTILLYSTCPIKLFYESNGSTSCVYRLAAHLSFSWLVMVYINIYYQRIIYIVRYIFPNLFHPVESNGTMQQECNMRNMSFQ